MYLKIINPKTKNSKYYNTGSSKNVCNYLKHEAEKKGCDVSYFDAKNDNISDQNVIEKLDNNVKGLKKDDVKFHSLIINPSNAELDHIGNSDELLKDYVRDLMGEYANTFKLKNNVSPDDLLWYATIHEERTYKRSDIYYSKKECEEKGLEYFTKKPGMENKNIGDPKPGENKHIHIAVSARNKEMTQTLNPTAANGKNFRKTDFFKNGVILFANKFDRQQSLVDYESHILQKHNRSLQNASLRIKNVTGQTIDFDTLSDLRDKYGYSNLQTAIGYMFKKYNNGTLHSFPSEYIENFLKDKSGISYDQNYIDSSFDKNIDSLFNKMKNMDFSNFNDEMDNEILENIKKMRIDKKGFQL